MADGIAVLIPCLDEAPTIGATVAAFRAALPAATIYVFDNGSTDATAAEAEKAGAVVCHVADRGKGNVVRRMFADVDADLYLMVDGDDTYDATTAPALVRFVEDGADMAVGRRVPSDPAAYRAGHRLGNRLFTRALGLLFGTRFTDIFSGYRAFSRRFVKSFPALSTGFEIETELSVHALTLDLPIAELPVPYKARPPGSASKLSTFRDGFRILRVLLDLFKNERPLAFFALVAALFAFTAVGLAIPIFTTYLATGLVPRFPTAILSASLMLLAFLVGGIGLVLDAVKHGRRELKRLAYLQASAPQRKKTAP